MFEKFTPNNSPENEGETKVIPEIPSTEHRDVPAKSIYDVFGEELAAELNADVREAVREGERAKVALDQIGYFLDMNPGKISRDSELGMLEKFLKDETETHRARAAMEQIDYFLQVYPDTFSEMTPVGSFLDFLEERASLERELMHPETTESAPENMSGE